MNKYISLILIMVTIDNTFSQILKRDNEDFTSIAANCGLKVEEYDIDTEDGYILKLFRIPGNVTRPVLLVHGILDSAYTFIIRRNYSISYKLAEAGYDVWLINLRGVTYSRRHKELKSTDPMFWDFSFHDTGVYDLPATIDFVLEATGQNKLSAVGHSQGNTVFYVLGATRPEYNDKVKIMVALGPVCYLNNLASPLTDLVESGPVINEMLLAENQEEIFPDESIYKSMIDGVCKMPEIGYSVCGGFIFQFAGDDRDELSPDIYYDVIEHYPTSTSRKNALHLMQTAVSREFAMFDYGTERNIKVYGTTIPPKYDLSKVTMNVALFAGKNDKLAPLKDVYRLRKSLPNVVEFRVMEREKYNHLDHVWGKNIDKYLIPHLLNLLNRYT